MPLVSTERADGAARLGKEHIMAQKHSNEPVDEFKPRKLFSYPKYWA